MLYTVSALALNDGAAARLVDALVCYGIARKRITVSPNGSRPASKEQQTMIAIKTADLIEAEHISDLLARAGGRAVQSSGDSSALDIV